jgi:hypothetical protein
MKLLVLLLCLGCTTQRVGAQVNTTWVDAQAMRIPDTVTFDVNKFALYLQQHFKAPQEKVRATYHWICSNIRYRTDSMYLSNWGDAPMLRANATLQRRSGLCDHYAGLMALLLLQCNIKAVVVSGYTIGGNGINFTGHSWVAVQSGANWLLCDPTWDAGSTDYRYYLVTPQTFIETHFPFDPLWQLLPEPQPFAGFGKKRLPKNVNQLPVDVNAAVAAFLQLDTLAQLNAAAARMLAAGFVNDKHKTWYDYNRMKTAIVNEELEIEKYNQVTNTYNSAVKHFNWLRQNQNNGPDALKLVFDDGSKAILQAEQQLKKLNSNLLENYNYDIVGLKKQIAQLKQRLNNWWDVYRNKQKP